MQSSTGKQGNSDNSELNFAFQEKGKEDGFDLVAANLLDVLGHLHTLASLSLINAMTRLSLHVHKQHCDRKKEKNDYFIVIMMWRDQG